MQNILYSCDTLCAWIGLERSIEKQLVKNPTQDSAFRQRDHVSLRAGQRMCHVLTRDRWRMYLVHVWFNFFF